MLKEFTTKKLPEGCRSFRLMAAIQSWVSTAWQKRQHTVQVFTGFHLRPNLLVLAQSTSTAGVSHTGLFAFGHDLTIKAAEIRWAGNSWQISMTSWTGTEWSNVPAIAPAEANCDTTSVLHWRETPPKGDNSNYEFIQTVSRMHKPIL